MCHLCLCVNNGGTKTQAAFVQLPPPPLDTSVCLTMRTKAGPPICVILYTTAFSDPKESPLWDILLACTALSLYTHTHRHHHTLPRYAPSPSGCRTINLSVLLPGRYKEISDPGLIVRDERRLVLKYRGFHRSEGRNLIVLMVPLITYEPRFTPGVTGGQRQTR